MIGKRQYSIFRSLLCDEEPPPPHIFPRTAISSSICIDKQTRTGVIDGLRAARRPIATHYTHHVKSNKIYVYCEPIATMILANLFPEMRGSKINLFHMIFVGQIIKHSVFVRSFMLFSFSSRFVFVYWFSFRSLYERVNRGFVFISVLRMCLLFKFLGGGGGGGVVDGGGVAVFWFIVGSLVARLPSRRGFSHAFQIRSVRRTHTRQTQKMFRSINAIDC